MPRSFPNSPMHIQPSSSGLSLMLLVVPGTQQDTRRVKIFRRFGFESALNISENSSIFLLEMFDMFRTIMPHLISVKLFQKNDTGKLRAFLEKFTFSFIAIRQPRPILLFRRGSQDGVSKKEISCLRKGGYFDIEPRD